MPAPKQSDAKYQRALDVFHGCGKNMTQAAELLSVARQTMQSQLKEAKARGLRPSRGNPGFVTASVLDETLPIEALLERRRQQYKHLNEAKQQRKLTPVRVKLDGPIGISHFGDPHVDDDGTDIEKIEDHIRIIKATPGLFAANIGDTLNNWTGRLARLYAEQSTSAQEAWKLGEWFLRELPWLYVLGGNHGAWSGAGDPVKWILENCQGLFDNFAVRLGLKFPNGKEVRINARHDFSGHSMWNPVHGPLKAATMGWRDHLLICGHLHISGYAILKDPSAGLVSHAIRVSSYKTHDRYAHEKGLPNQDIFCNAVTIINPKYADDDPRLIHTCFDVEEGADYLTWLRNRKS
jgi:hypothetical protein